MKILLNNNDLNEALSNVFDLGFVPTMGSLHKGHISLIRKSLKECKKTIVSIFVNPTQFNDKNDYKKYPRDNKKDLLILKKLKVDFVYLPKEKHVYNTNLKYSIKLSKKDRILCAKFRKNHFEGVINVMDRLVKLINAKKIYMGEKDYQQLYLVKRHIEKKYRSQIISCKTIRDKNKLALSSRNLLLKKKELINAQKLTKNLIMFKKGLKINKHLKKLLLTKKKNLNKLYEAKIEYLELRNKINLKVTRVAKDSKLFVAYYMNKTRLIDNF